MCIVLFTTAHPEYSLVLIDNRDEYILRPTSRPHWWTHPITGEQVLSSRDLHRAGKGTWLGVTKSGNLAVLTNYRESEVDDVDQRICGINSRGRVVTSWLGGLAGNGIAEGVRRLVEEEGVKGVGGFSLICGKLRKKGEGVAIVSNRVDVAAEVPVVAKSRGETYALSNTTFNNPIEWKKTKDGKVLMEEAVRHAVANKQTREEFTEALFSVLDTDTLPESPPGATLAEFLTHLRNSIFIEAGGTDVHKRDTDLARAKGHVTWDEAEKNQKPVEDQLAAQHPDLVPSRAMTAFETGIYGTQRQTVLLVDWEGNATFIERALFDPNGNQVARGEGDVTFRFKIDRWDE